jgi:methyl-accepting chemotaxis protein
MRKFSIGRKLLIGGLAAVIIPILVIGVFSVYRATMTISELAIADLDRVADSLAETVEIAMSEQAVKVRNISFSTTVIAAADKVARDGVAAAQNEITAAHREVEKMREADNRLSSILVVGKDGIAFAGAFRGLNVKDRDYLAKAFQGKIAFSEAIKSRATGRPIVTVAAPIYAPNGKAINGAIVMGVETKFFTDIIDKLKIGSTGYAYLVDNKGFYITHPVKESILKVNVSQVKGMESIAAHIAGDKKGNVEYVVDGVRKIAALAPVPVTGWSVVTTLPSDELFAPAATTRNTIVLAGLVFLALASLFFYFFSRTLTRPLECMVEAARKISRGNLDIDTLDEERRDEIGILAKSFGFMVRSLREKAEIAGEIAGGNLTVEVKPSSDEDLLGKALATMVEQLRRQVRETVEGVNILASAGSEIMASVAQMTSSSSETSVAVSETTTTVEEVKQTADMTTQKAKHVSDLGRKTVDISRVGTKAVEDTISGMERIREQVESIADMVVRLSEQSQAIGEIISTVSDLAEQSNLLAVNASIEAAKAGEHGRGFVVVAQEMRSLAEQSRQSTMQVRGILFDVQKAISSAVMATEQGNRAVETGVRLSTQAGEAIESLSASVEEATNASIQIAASSQQQLIGMEQVVRAMENVREASIQNALSTKQTEKAASDLHDLGQRMKELVSHYRI